MLRMIFLRYVGEDELLGSNFGGWLLLGSVEPLNATWSEDMEQYWSTLINPKILLPGYMVSAMNMASVIAVVTFTGHLVPSIASRKFLLFLPGQGMPELASITGVPMSITRSELNSTSNPPTHGQRRWKGVPLSS